MKDLEGIAKQIVKVSPDNKYKNYINFKKLNISMRSKYLELIFREKDLFLNKDLYCLLFI